MKYLFALCPHFFTISNNLVHVLSFSAIVISCMILLYQSKASCITINFHSLEVVIYDLHLAHKFLRSFNSAIEAQN